MIVLSGWIAVGSSLFSSVSSLSRICLRGMFCSLWELFILIDGVCWASSRGFCSAACFRFFVDFSSVVVLPFLPFVSVLGGISFLLLFLVWCFLVSRFLLFVCFLDLLVLFWLWWMYLHHSRRLSPLRLRGFWLCCAFWMVGLLCGGFLYRLFALRLFFLSESAFALQYW